MKLLIFGVIAIISCQVGASPLLIEGDVDYEERELAYQKQFDEYLKTVPKAVAEEAKMSIVELIQSKGYPAEAHTVVTEDGYILAIHRIPHGKSGPSKNRPVVFLQHGLLCSAADWVITGPESALAYYLADEGYDVWMGNARGTRYSRNHTSLTPKDGDFWKFSWHEIGVYDLPKMIDYVLENTGEKKLFYAGHSQGTTSFYIMCSEKPEYNDKIIAHFSLAPVAYMKYMFSPLLRLVSLAEGGLEALANLIGMHEFLPHTSFLAHVGELLCGDDSFTQALCTNALFAISGFSPKQMNATILPVLMGHTPAGAATRQLLHYAQEINSGHFRKYDFGLIGNLRRYGKLTPPKYKLEDITAPIYLIYSSNDWLAHTWDVNKLYKQLPNVQAKFLVTDKKFNHLDFLFGIDARELVYNKMVSLMTRHK